MVVLRFRGVKPAPLRRPAALLLAHPPRWHSPLALPYAPLSGLGAGPTQLAHARTLASGPMTWLIGRNQSEALRRLPGLWANRVGRVRAALLFGLFPKPPGSLCLTMLVPISSSSISRCPCTLAPSSSMISPPPRYGYASASRTTYLHHTTLNPVADPPKKDDPLNHSPPTHGPPRATAAVARGGTLSP